MLQNLSPCAVNNLTYSFACGTCQSLIPLTMVISAHIEQMMVLMVIYLYILVTCSYSNLARSI